MGKMSREKGKRGEREFARLCQAQGYDAKRTAQHCGKNGGEADVKGLPGVHVEVKRVEKFDLYGAVDQAKRDAEGRGLLHMVAHRRNNHEWVAIMPIEDWFAMYREWEAGQAIKEDHS